MNEKEKLIMRINDIQENIEILEEIRSCIKNGSKAHIGTYSIDHVLIVPSATALQLLNEEKPRLKTKLEQLEKKL